MNACYTIYDIIIVNKFKYKYFMKIFTFENNHPRYRVIRRTDVKTGEISYYENKKAVLYHVANVQATGLATALSSGGKYHGGRWEYVYIDIDNFENA